MEKSISSVFWVDCQYVRAQFAAAYIVKHGDYAAIVETGTKHNVQIILDELKNLGIERKNVLYIIPTHVHLDHAGGAGYLAMELPNAKVLVHPRGRMHLANPQRLKESSIEVYGEEIFSKLYGDIQAVADERLWVSEHEMEIPLGDDTLKIFHCEGHASHHFVVMVKSLQVVFTGDTFGIGYPEVQPAEGNVIYPSATPIDFNAAKAIESIDLILSLKPKAVALTHFGIYSEVEEIGVELKEDLKLFGAWVEEASVYESQADMINFLSEKIFKFFQNKLASKKIAADKMGLLEDDIKLNAAGLSVAAVRLKKRRRE